MGEKVVLSDWGVISHEDMVFRNLNILRVRKVQVKNIYMLRHIFILAGYTIRTKGDVKKPT